MSARATFWATPGRPSEGTEAELSAMFPHRQLCCECGRYVHLTQDMRCDDCNAPREEDR